MARRRCGSNVSLILGIDTVGRGGSVSLVRDGQPVAWIEHDTSEGYAETLLGLVDRALAAAGAARADIDRVAVIAGPGSFTGLRIGIMTAKGLAFAAGIPLHCAETLPLIASAASAGPVVAAFAAGGRFVYAAAYDGEAESVAPARIEAGELSGFAPSSDSTFAWCGPPPTDTSGWESIVAADAPRCPVARLSEQLARRVAEGEWPTRLTDPRLLVPLYLSPSQAERVHGLDLGDEVNRPVPPTPWE